MTDYKTMIHLLHEARRTVSPNSSDFAASAHMSSKTIIKIEKG